MSPEHADKISAKSDTVCPSIRPPNQNCSQKNGIFPAPLKTLFSSSRQLLSSKKLSTPFIYAHRILLIILKAPHKESNNKREFPFPTRIPKTMVIQYGLDIHAPNNLPLQPITGKIQVHLQSLEAHPGELATKLKLNSGNYLRQHISNILIGVNLLQLH